MFLPEDSNAKLWWAGNSHSIYESYHTLPDKAGCYCTVFYCCLVFFFHMDIIIPQINLLDNIVLHICFSQELSYYLYGYGFIVSG